MSEQSKTPRTDKAEKADRESCEMSREHGEPSAFRSAGYDFARTLECELAGLQAMTCPNCATLALRDEEGAALRARVAALEGAIKQLPRFTVPSIKDNPEFNRGWVAAVEKLHSALAPAPAEQPAATLVACKAGPACGAKCDFREPHARGPGCRHHVDTLCPACVPAKGGAE